MNQSSHLPSGRIRHYLPLLILGPAVLAAILMLTAYLTQYDGPSANYFARGAVLPILATVFALLSAVSGTVIAFRFPRGAFRNDSVPAPSASFASAGGFLLCAVVLTVSVVRSGFKWYHAVTLLLLLLSVAYFILQACGRPTESRRNLTVLLGIAPVFGLVLLCAIHYFDRSVEMNAPVKVTVLLGLLTAMVTVTGEIRYLLGTALPRVFLMLSSWTVAAGSLTLFALPAVFLSGAFDKTAYLASALAILGCSISGGVRIVALLRSENEPTEVRES